MWGIDTAKAYGNAENVIGEFFANNGKVLNVITKLPEREYITAGDVEEEVYGSLENMKISSIDCLLVHSYKTFKLYGKIIVPVLRSLYRDGVIKSYGVSVYHPGEVLSLRKEISDGLAIEFPLNLFDQRFLKDELIKKLKEDGCMLFARSVFLQGLFFLGKEKLEGRFVKAGNGLAMIGEISREYGIRPEHMAILFVATNPWLDGFVFGIDSQEHLLNNIRCLTEENISVYEALKHRLPDLETEDEDIILPYKWGRN